MSDLIQKFPAYGSCSRGEYRVSGGDLGRTQHELYKMCCDRVEHVCPCHEFQEKLYLGSGWEWSAFSDGDTIVKVPAGVFLETSDPRYLENTKMNCEVVGRYVDSHFIAKTEFSGEPPNIRQDVLLPIPKKVFFAACKRNTWCPLIEQLLKLLNSEEWLPDLNIKVEHAYFAIRSIMQDKNGIPKIMDFTAYFDVFRLYADRTRREVRDRGEDLQRILSRLR